MSNVATPGDGDDAVSAANNVIESEVANVLIEIEMAKAIRVGLMLRQWRQLMIEDEKAGRGVPFPEDWVDECAMNIFLKFFPPPSDETTIYGTIESD